MVSAIVLLENNIPNDEIALRRIIDALRSAQVLDIIIICNAIDERFESSIESFGVKTVRAGNTDECSVLAKAIDTLDQNELHGIMVIPVPQQVISQGIIVDLLREFWVSHSQIVAARIDGKSEFLIIADTLFNAIREQPAGIALDPLLALHADKLLEVHFDKNGNPIQPPQWLCPSP